MKTFILLFRGINVGGNNILPMKELTQLLQKLGYYNVRTYIQSGNVICNGASKPSIDISREIKKTFGFEPNFLVLNPPDIVNAIANNPYNNKEGKTVHCFFCEKRPAKASLQVLSEYKGKSENYAAIGKIVYLHAPDGIARSKFVAKIESVLNVTVTARNLNTVNKLCSVLPT